MERFEDNILNMQKKLRLMRQVFDVTTIAFADMIGVTRQTVYNIETGKTLMTKTQYLAIAHIMMTLVNDNAEKFNMAKNVWEADYDECFENVIGLKGNAEANAWEK